MSNTDMKTQGLFFDQSWHVAAVLNPQNGIWLNFIGSNAAKTKAHVVTQEK